ncbi:protein LSM12-like [Lineus longissimus]|uniref:protein LSM12-like n=1 Tax=Lineus longissimus TaxID=88925 RepID=UPI002B4EFCBA
MKINMAEGDYFNIGSTIACTTCHGQKIQGEVIAFDYGSRMLALKMPPTSGKPGQNDVRLVNLSFVSDMNLIKEGPQTPPALSNLNLHKLQSRLQSNLQEKQRQIDYIGVDVTPEGQNVFNAITKTIKEVHWEGKTIVVFDQVTIVPPYCVEHVRCREGTPAQGQTSSQKALEHVRKIVEKYYRELDTGTLSSSPQ